MEQGIRTEARRIRGALGARPPRRNPIARRDLSFTGRRRGIMRVVLAEKPSVARELAAFLGAGSRHDGYFEGRGYQVTWALGHLATLKEPEDYDPALKRWSLATLPFVPDRFEVKLLDEKGARQQFAVVQRLFHAAEELICATDAGREGELIFRYILELTGCTGK